MPSFVHNYADFVSWIGLIVSIAGMVLTILTLITARGIKTRLMRRFQLPQMIKDLQDGLTELNGILSKADFSAQNLKEIIGRLSVTLDNAHKKTKGVKVANAKRRAEELLGFQVLTKENGRDFILEMTRAHQELFLERRDDPWNI